MTTTEFVVEADHHQFIVGALGSSPIQPQGFSGHVCFSDNAFLVFTSLKMGPVRVRVEDSRSDLGDGWDWTTEGSILLDGPLFLTALMDRTATRVLDPPETGTYHLRVSCRDSAPWDTTQDEPDETYLIEVWKD